jgi:chemotaxis signal transduction protein
MSQEQRVLCFKSGKHSFAVPIQMVKEVLAPQILTPTPGTPHYYRGLANVRGETISVWDACAFFGTTANANSECAIIVLENQSKKLGIFVDSVESVQKPTPDQLSEPPIDIHFSQNNISVLKVFQKPQSQGLESYLVLNVNETFFKQNNQEIAS